MGCEYRTAFERLDALAERGDVDWKRIGPRARVWWRPLSAAGRTAPERPNESEPSKSPRSGERDRIERILEASPVSIVVVEPSGEIAFTNERAEETLGLERDEITSRTYRQPDWKISYEDGTPVPVETPRHSRSGNRRS